MSKVSVFYRAAGCTSHCRGSGVLLNCCVKQGLGRWAKYLKIKVLSFSLCLLREMWQNVWMIEAFVHCDLRLNCWILTRMFGKMVRVCIVLVVCRVRSITCHFSWVERFRNLFYILASSIYMFLLINWSIFEYIYSHLQYFCLHYLIFFLIYKKYNSVEIH